MSCTVDKLLQNLIVVKLLKKPHCITQVEDKGTTKNERYTILTLSEPSLALY